jgi:mycoredoxin
VKRLNRWGAAAALAAVAVLALVLHKQEESWLPTVAAAVALLAVSWFISPAFPGRHTTWSQVRDDGAEPAVVIFWRPGCIYCLRLKAALGGAGRGAMWVNIWRDEEAAGFVRGHNGGNETVPTVILGGKVLTNPAPALVRQALAAGHAR